MLTDGPVSATWHATDGQRGAGEALVAFSGGSAGDVPGVDAVRSAPRTTSRRFRRCTRAFAPVSCADASWTGRRTRGSRPGPAFPAPGQVTAQGPTFRQGLGRLHFAGEYCSYAFMGYMEGAFELRRRRRAPHRHPWDGVIKDKAA